MAFIECHCSSNVLGMAVDVWVVLPQAGYEKKKRKERAQSWPVMYLLHGLSDDHSIWMRRTSIERYATDLGLAVIMPSVHRSFYTDMVQGGAYGTFVSEELPFLMHQFFPLSRKRDETFVAGLSMGGYGAFKLALSCPERFAAAASFSGALDMANDSIRGRIGNDMTLVYGDELGIAGSSNDLFHLADRLVSSGKPRPRLYQWCGTDDELCTMNRRFRNHARKIGLALEYSEGPGAHTWDCWDRQIQKTIPWLLRSSKH